MSGDKTPRRITAATAAQILGVNAATVRLLADAGRLPADRMPGGTWLFERNIVERFAAERRLAAGQEAAR